MSKQNPRGITAKWVALSTGRKAAAVAAASIAVLGGISVPAYSAHQNRQALILAEQQERHAAEQAEMELIAVEQARLDKEARMEAGRIAAEEEAARLEAERLEQERAAEEEQARLEAEAQAESERLAAEKEVAVEQQPEPATQQPSASNAAEHEYTGGPEGAIGDPMTGPMPASPATSWSATGEPTSGSVYDLARYYNASWIAEKNRWEYTSEFGITRAIYPEGNTEILHAPEPTSGEGKVQANRMGGVWAPEFAGWVFYSDMGKSYVMIFEMGGSKVLAGEEITIAKRYIG